MSMLDQHRRQMTREREKKLRLSKDVQSISKRLSEKRAKVPKPRSTDGLGRDELALAVAG